MGYDNFPLVCAPESQSDACFVFALIHFLFVFINTAIPPVAYLCNWKGRHGWPWFRETLHYRASGSPQK